MKVKKTKEIVISVIISVIVLFFVSAYFWDKAKRCEANGYTRENANKIAMKKLEIDFNNFSSFMLKNEQFDEYDKNWMFTFKNDGCNVDVIVDKCGVSDIGGLTENCFPLQK